MSNRMLTRLGVIYGPPQSADPIAYLDELAKMLAKYSEAVLEQATDMVLRTHRGRHWPTPSECVAACERVLETERATSRQNGTGDRHPEWSAEAQRIADRLIQSELGRRAAREGWVVPLWDYCRRARALPDAAGIHRCRVIAREFEEAWATIRRGEGHAGLNASLCRLGESVLARRNKLAALAMEART